jgi:hypothetical protein
MQARDQQFCGWWANHRLEVTAARNGLRRTRMAAVGQRLLSRGVLPDAKRPGERGS